jgi:hypothetical protein
VSTFNGAVPLQLLVGTWENIYIAAGSKNRKYYRFKDASEDPLLCTCGAMLGKPGQIAPPAQRNPPWQNNCTFGAKSPITWIIAPTAQHNPPWQDYCAFGTTELALVE